MTTMSTNGPAKRKQLSDQLDRLDGIIDALAEALPQAVADACREGARQAVKDAVVEILSSPELRSLITGLAAARMTPPPAEPASPPTPTRSRFWTRVKTGLSTMTDAVTSRIRTAATAVTTTVRTLSAILPLKKILLVGTGVGLAVGVLSYVCPHAVSAVVSGVGGAVTAVGVQIGGWFRRSVGAFDLVGTS